jgi:HSP20 family molecular chaperone IbpA
VKKTIINFSPIWKDLLSKFFCEPYNLQDLIKKDDINFIESYDYAIISICLPNICEKDIQVKIKNSYLCISAQSVTEDNGIKKSYSIYNLFPIPSKFNTIVEKTFYNQFLTIKISKA